MENVELVIKIPEEQYLIANYGQYGHIDIDIVKTAIRNGTPLPKGHGRLIDADALDVEWVCTHDGNYECVKSCSCEKCCDSEYQCYTNINDAPSIIEADRSEE